MEQLIIAFGERGAAFIAWLCNPLTQLLFWPLLGMLAICLTPKERLQQIRIYALLASGLSLLTAVLMLTGVPQWLLANPFFAQFTPFRPDLLDFQFKQQFTWLQIVLGETQSFAVQYFVGVDGLNMPLILLAAAVMFLAIIWALPRTERVRDFFALTLLMEIGILGVFVALDYVLFYLFWELMLIPMFFLIAIFGHDRERAGKAALKFFVFTMFGGVFMLISFIAMNVLSTVYSFSIPGLTQFMTGPGAQIMPAARTLMFIGLLLGFAVKVPMFPFHTWLPDAHTEAPTEMSVILAAVMLKTGTYAYLRTLYPTFPDVAYAMGPLIAACGVIGIVYGAAVTLVQTDFKRLVAYSSISHMGFIVLGISTMTPDGTVGAVFQMVAHGVVIATLFFMSGVIERRYGTRDLRVIGGMLKGAPSYALLLGLAAFAGMGLPGLIGFWGEFLTLKAAYFNGPNWSTVVVGGIDGARFLQIVAILAVIGILTAAVYMINMLQKVLPGSMPGTADGQPEAVTATTPQLDAANAVVDSAVAEIAGATPQRKPFALAFTWQPHFAEGPGPWRGFRLNEGFALVPLGISIVLFGLYPAPIVNACLPWAYAVWANIYLRF
jgi:NADH-quinone oxidoreductase subunit M